MYQPFLGIPMLGTHPVVGIPSSISCSEYTLLCTAGYVPNISRYTHWKLFLGMLPILPRSFFGWTTLVLWCSLIASPWHPWWEAVWWTKSSFLGLFPKCRKDQSDCEITELIIDYYNALPSQQLKFTSQHSHPNIFHFLSRFGANVLNVARSY